MSEIVIIAMGCIVFTVTLCYIAIKVIDWAFGRGERKRRARLIKEIEEYGR